MKTPDPQKLKSIFDQYYAADIALWTTFAGYLQSKKFKKGEVIKDYHQTEKYINILVSGSAAHFVQSKDKDICINLYYENHIFSDYLSFLIQQPTIIKTECLEDSEIWRIHHSDLSALYKRSARGVLIGKALSDALFIRKQFEQINLLTLSPTERYLKLVKEQPTIFQRTSLKIIASYLGITPESLSRIRNKIS